ncbi:MAG: septation regulator SpoVG [Bacillota bacterium]|jgi:stage V sporulation protein G
MDITDVRVRKLLAEGKMKAIASVTIDNAFVIHDVKVVDGQSGLFVAMPSRKTANGEFRDIAHPISQEARNIIQNKVLEKYQEALENRDAIQAEEEEQNSEDQSQEELA